MKCDLHLHTTCSDGSFTPEEIVALAKEKGIDVIAVTDHDTTKGVELAQREGQKLGVKVIGGIEVSTLSGNKEVHVLGFNLDTSTRQFAQDVNRLSQMRNNRNKQLVAKLKKHGIEIDLDQINTHGKSIGRADIAKEMVAKGYCKDVPEAFENYIGNGKKCYVQVRRMSTVEAVEFIAKHKGVSVLAHPKNLHMTQETFEKFLQSLVKAGLCGIEADYFTHTTAERKFYNQMAKKYNLFVTGGSDFHSTTYGVAIGKKTF
jgi:predicted metal-dependent phosphoesterase TrpH